VRYEDLPPDMQRQVLEKVGKPPRTRSRKGDSKDATNGTCHACGERFTSVRLWEEHSKANPGHRRFELIGSNP
jgi:hypothetical protein